MAKKNRGNGSAAKSNVEIPDGFNINVGRERGDGWVKKEEGNEVLGRLLGRYTYESRGKKRAYYQIRLLKPCRAEVLNPQYDPDNEELMEEEKIPERLDATLEEGAIVNLDETVKLADLQSRTGDGGVYDMWLVYGKKQDIGDGQTMWNIVGPRLRLVEKASELP